MVDDEPTTIDVLAMFLEAEGYTDLVTTTDSARTLDLLIRERPDILLLNLVMPGQSGLEILRSMRGDASLREIPVVILTSSTDAKAKSEAFDLGATDFLAKPVDPSELSLRVRNILSAVAYRGHRDGMEPLAEASGSPGAQRQALTRTRAAQTAVSEPRRVESRLAGDPRFHAILAKFAQRLHGKLEAMEACHETGDFDELVSLAHWLVGAAGTVGFDAFGEPAAELRNLAAQRKRAEIEAPIRELRALADCLVLPGRGGSRASHDPT